MKRFGSIEYISIGNEFSSGKGIPDPLCHVQHFGIEVTDPLQFIGIVPVQGLDQFFGFIYDIGVNPLALEFRHNSKGNPGEPCVGIGFFDPEEFQLLPEAKLAVQVFEPLIQIG